jgi:mycothiol system anti-sigma-R factor
MEPMPNCCEEIARQLYQYIDRELSPDEQRQVQQHLDDCPPCQKWFRLEVDVLRLVGECGRRLEAPPTLIEKVRRLCASGQSDPHSS